MVVPEERRHPSRDRQALGRQLPAVPVVEGEDACALVQRPDLLKLRRHRRRRIDDKDAAIVGEEQRRAPAMRRAAKSPSITAAARRRPAAVPERDAADPRRGGDEQRLLDLVERHWGAARAMPMWPLIDRKAESEAPRAATVERRKERKLPDVVEQVGCDGLGHGGSSAR